MKNILFGSIVGCLFVVVSAIAMWQSYIKQPIAGQYLIHCKVQTTKDHYRDDYYVVNSYWLDDNGCLAAEFQDQLLPDLCDSCHAENDEKFRNYMREQYENLR